MHAACSGEQLARFSVVPPAELPENHLRWAKTGEGRLDEVNANEDGEEEPPRTDEVRKSDTEKDKAAGEDTDEGFGFHD
jgi:hypothetical protein